MEQKLSGRVQASDVATITLDDIRYAPSLFPFLPPTIPTIHPPTHPLTLLLSLPSRGGPTFVRDKLLALSRSSSSTSSTSSNSIYVVVNAVTRSDLECAVLGSLMAEDVAEGGASIVYVQGGSEGGWKRDSFFVLFSSNHDHIHSFLALSFPPFLPPFAATALLLTGSLYVPGFPLFLL